ncbi:SEC-C metal-binding domain-containing protein [Anatilimnocola sp. NA78]|uniref:SEC-C metal-binding domain-containing protein n=1 Tax=Anatilimnocola sp. NA78 TaxID=3415683 RepID=UPI003CE542C5
MKLPLNEAKAKLLDEDRDVRAAALSYLGLPGNADGTVLPLVVEAYQKFGPQAFQLAVSWRDLPLTKEPLVWLIEAFGTISEAIDAEDHYYSYGDVLAEAIANAPLSLVEETRTKWEQLPLKFGERINREIEPRKQLAQLNDQDLFERAVHFCLEQTKAREDAEPWDELVRLGEEMAQRPEAFAQRAVDMLRANQCAGLIEAEGDASVDDTSEARYWLQLAMIRVVNNLRLEAAIPELLKLVESEEEALTEDAIPALSNIGTDEVVRQASECYCQANEQARLGLLEIIENSRSVQNTAALLSLAQDETGAELHGLLLQGALRNLDRDAIEIARQYILTNEKTPELLDVRTGLLVASKCLGVTFPEFAEWKADQANDQAFRKAYYLKHPRFPTGASYLQEEAEDLQAELRHRLFANELSLPGYGVEPPAPLTSATVRRGERVGRNDPCPCGSGKKYKKCCLRGDQEAEIRYYI